MSISNLVVQYNREDVTTDGWIRLSQKPVSSNKLTSADLDTMLSLVQSGISARAYKPPSCEASVLKDKVQAELQLNVWPSSLSFQYTLEGDLVTIESKSSLQEWHEFDLIVPMADSVELPYLSKSTEVTWQTPSYNSRGEEVEQPSLTITPTSLHLSAEVFCVLRVRCLAVGWSHVLLFSMAKTETSSITDLKPAVTLTWAGGEQRLDLKLPGCLEALLEYCPDGNSKRSRAFSTVDNEDDDVVPVVYWSPCSGRFLAVRYEKP